MERLPDVLVRGLTTDGAFRLICVRTTHLTADICQRQQTDPTATVALGRLLAAGALMTGLLKPGQRLALAVEGNGPLRRLQVEGDADGRICGTIAQPVAALPPREGHYDVATAIGRAGFLRVIKDLGLKEPYQGMVQLSSSEIGEDLAHYFMVSEQTPACVNLGVLLDPQAGVDASGGFLIQVLPGCPEQALELLEQQLAQLPPLSQLLATGTEPAAILQTLFPTQSLQLYPPQPLRFSCHCNRDRASALLASLPTTEQNGLAASAAGLLITCEYCKTQYRFTPEDLASTARLDTP